MFQRFSDRGKKIMSLACREAQRLRSTFIGTEHILLALVRDGPNVATAVLRDCDADQRKVLGAVEKRIVASESASAGFLPFSPHACKAIVSAEAAADSLGRDRVDAEHLLLGLLREGGHAAADILADLGVGFDVAAKKVLGFLDCPSVLSLQLEHRTEGGCGVCLQPLDGRAPVSCRKCQARYHSDCWEYNGRRCAMFGCVVPAPSRPEVRLGPVPPPGGGAEESAPGWSLDRDTLLVTMVMAAIIALCFVLGPGLSGRL